MNIREIKELAINFRCAADDAFEHGAFGRGYPFDNFPYECCDDMCDLFGQLLFEKEVPVFKVHGIYRYDNWENKYSHVWLQLKDGTIIDLTGDQYKYNPIMLNYDIPCYIGKPNHLHKLFSEEDQNFYLYSGIDDYDNRNTRERLWKLYDIIISFYKTD